MWLANTRRRASSGETSRRRDLLRLLGAAGVAGLAGCSGDGGAGTGTGTGAETGTSAGGGRSDQVTYTSASSVDAQSLNWLTTADSTSGAFVTATLDGAWAIKPGQEIFPLWADVSTDDGRVYEIELRDNLRWGGDYGQQTAEDWVYMIRNVFQAEPNWSGYPNAGDWFRQNPDSGQREPIPVEKTGTYTFEIQLFDVDPSFPFKPVMWRQQCIPRALLEQYVPEKDGEGLRQDEELNTLAYTGNLGPYTFEEWDRTSQYVVTRNDDYYLHDADVPDRFTNAPYFEEKAFQILKEESARLGALRAGDVHSAGIPPDKASQFETLESVSVNVTPQPYARILVYNMRANGWEPFRAKAVRQALAFAVNKRAIVENVLRGYAEVAQTMQPRWSKWYDDSTVVEYGVGDRYGSETTRSRLADALSETEYAYDGDALVDGSGEQVTLTLYFDQGQPTEQTIGEFVAQEIQQNAGIAVEPKSISTSTFQDKFVKTSPPQGVEPEWSAGVFNGGPRDVATSAEPWDMSINLQFNTYPFTPASSKGFFEKQGGINFYGYYPEADIAGLYEQASQTTDEARRQELFGEAFGLISEEQPFGFLAMPSSISGYDERVVGYDEEFNTGWDSQTWRFR
ncbi:ABC transporter substrate-binding protein [Salinirarus marinus]|uniref:ABC transporter substrate-binding protein n=1 Tax=Salinirarus marinus TaxID=3068310 RepID=UPI003C6C406F